MKIECNIDLLTATIYHGLKSLLSTGDTLPPRFLEFGVCNAFGFKHTGDSNWFADGINEKIQVSVKTRKLAPTILKNTGRDFNTHPEKFLGPQQNIKQGKHWNGLEFVQRRQEISNEAGSSARRIGLLTLRGFKQNIAESKKKFQVSETHEILLVHGYNWKMDRYMVNIYWQELTIPDPKQIVWSHVAGGVDGSIIINNKPHIIMHRVKGGAPREATCFKEFKDPTKYKNSVSISVPIPEPWPFDQDTVLAELNYLKEKQNADTYSILFTE